MNQNLLKTLKLLVLCASFVYVTPSFDQTKIEIYRSQNLEKSFPDTIQEWPASPIPTSLSRGAKKKGGKGKR